MEEDLRFATHVAVFFALEKMPWIGDCIGVFES